MNLQCYRCGEEKLPIEFSPYNFKLSPSQRICKRCKAKQMKSWRNGDPKKKWGRFILWKTPEQQLHDLWNK